MKYQFLMIHPDEDGNVVDFLTRDQVEERLTDPEYMGHLIFLSEKDLETKGTNPQYWKHYNPEIECLLIELGKGIVVPKPVTRSWTLR